MDLKISDLNFQKGRKKAQQLPLITAAHDFSLMSLFFNAEKKVRKKKENFSQNKKRSKAFVTHCFSELALLSQRSWLRELRALLLACFRDFVGYRDFTKRKKNQIEI